eukprot:11184-Heterococcus_DN1.PRE.4
MYVLLSLVLTSVCISSSSRVENEMLTTYVSSHQAQRDQGSTPAALVCRVRAATPVYVSNQQYQQQQL